MKKKLYKLYARLSSLTALLLLLFTTTNAQIVSQYVETNSGSIPKGIEIWNNTTTAFDFSVTPLTIQYGSNGAFLSNLFTVSSGTLAPGAVMVLGTTDIGVYLTNQGLGTVFYYEYTFLFNGDDALGVFYNGALTDVVGNPIGSDLVNAWTGNGVSTQNQNIQLLPGITTGDVDGWTDPSLRFETVSTTPVVLPAGLAGLGIPPASGPTLSVNPSVLNGLSYSVGNGPSESQSYNLSGSSLTPAGGNITITPSANYEISLNNTDFSTTAVTIPYTGGALASIPVYVRLEAGLTPGNYNGEVISNAGGGATTVNVTVNGMVSNPATHLSFSNFPTAGFINQAVNSFTVEALNVNDLVDPGYTGNITLTKVSGPGDLAGTLTQAAVAGIATFNDISFTATGTYTIQASATGLTSTTSQAIVISLPPSITADLLPLYMSGSTPANNRVPFAYRATLENLLPNATYRYINTAIDANDGPTSGGAGVLIYVNADGTFSRFTTGSFTSGYGEFTTNASGSYSGWFMLEPSGNQRFDPGDEVFMRIRLNNGAGGETAVNYLTIPESVTVLQFSPEATDISGSAIRATSLATPANFVMLYDNMAGTGRPLFGTSIETTGLDFTAITQYTAFYRDEVSGNDGSWGGIIPNVNPAGLQLIREYSRTTGAIVNQDSSADGVWGFTDTRNPVYGLDSVLVIHLAPEILTATIPAFIQGSNGTNNSRVPYAFYTTLTYLQPNATYRYYNKAVLSTDPITNDGVGNTIIAEADGTFTRTTTNSMSTAGQYGEFTTDNAGNFSGWFMLEPTGESEFTPGNGLHMRIMLNDGEGGNTVAVRLTSSDTASVIDFGAAYNDVTGTGIRGVSLASSGNMVYIYGNETGEGQPLFGTSIETTGLDLATTGNYASFYNEVSGVNGSWGGIVPNVIPEGVRRIEERSNADGSLLNVWTSPDGVWSNVDTRNPLGGEETELFINLIPTGDPVLTAIPTNLSGFTYIEGEGPSASQTYTLTAIDLEGSGNIIVTGSENFEISLDGVDYEASIEIPFADGELIEQPVTVYVRMRIELPMGEYNNQIITNNGGGAPELIVTVSGNVTTSAIPGITDLVLPQYIEGINGTNTNRLPFAYRATLSYLTPNTTYRYYNKIVVENDLPDFNGAGNTIFVNADGTFTRTTQTSLETAGQYGEFTTDGTGSWAGWFITEPSGNDRFTPGNHVYMRININDGNDGIVEAQRFTTTQYATVLQLGTESTSTSGTAIWAISNDEPGNFVFLYNGTSDTLRPVYGTHIEASGVDFCSTGVYAPFYCDSVAGKNGNWGGIVPNINPEGIQMIQVLSNQGGEITETYQMLDGIWSGENTINPTGGADSALFINLRNIGINDPENEIARIWSRENEIIIEPVSTVEHVFTIYNLSGQSVGSYNINGNESIRINLQSGIYIGKLQNATGSKAVKLYIK